MAFDHSPAGICVTAGPLVTACNREFGWMLGCDPSELVGGTLADCHASRQHYAQSVDAAQAGLAGTGTHRDERLLRRRGGELFWCKVVARAVEAADPLQCVVWNFQDLSALRPVVPDLTDREQQIARQLMAGGTSKEIARLVGISPRTVEGHRGRLMRKLGVANQRQLVARLIGEMAMARQETM